MVLIFKRNYPFQKGEEQMVIQGLVIISDLEGASAAHLTLFNLAVMKKLITMLETAWPMKPKAEHVLNMPKVFESMHNLIMVRLMMMMMMTVMIMRW